MLNTYHKIFKLELEDSSSSFFSGFLYGYLKNKNIEECLRLGTICAGLCITSKELAFEGLSEALLQVEYEKYYN